MTRWTSAGTSGACRNQSPGSADPHAAEMPHVLAVSVFWYIDLHLI